MIQEPHLRAALAVWDYCRESAQSLFGQVPGRVAAGNTLVPEPDPLFLRLLNAITSTPGVTRSELLRTFRADKADAIGVGLEGLRAKGLAYPKMVQGEAGGRPAECWYPGAGGGSGGEPSGEPEGDDGLHEGCREWGSETVHPNPTPNPFAGLVVGADTEPVGKEWKEGINSPLPHPEREIVNSFLPSGDTPTPVAGKPVTENSSKAEPDTGMPASTPTPLPPRVDHDPLPPCTKGFSTEPFPPATLEPGTRLTKDHTGRTVRDCVNPTTVDVKGLTVDSFLETTWLWSPREGGGVCLKARGVANAGEVVDWFMANRKAIVDRVKADAERDIADTAFLEALDGA